MEMQVVCRWILLSRSNYFVEMVWMTVGRSGLEVEWILGVCVELFFIIWINMQQCRLTIMT